ncbi:hypothetical protein RHGRI_000429 [Rhododendron griersonianum]|uniref:Uncharacterized protein n=1 Tax=Rhododendron griersonianum TaxID=479676 RepID=A0AAV6LHN4_9ERIC|nr:hypothetical protein RHGRI_000429 [Rhododendron griersonianum]
MSIKFLLVLLLAVVALTTSSLADHHKPPTYPGHKPPSVEVEDAENNGIEENVKSGRSLAGERNPYVDVIDYAPAHAKPPIHHN